MMDFMVHFVLQTVFFQIQLEMYPVYTKYLPPFYNCPLSSMLKLKIELKWDKIPIF